MQALSMAIKELEHELGLSLIIRKRRGGIEFTEDGERILVKVGYCIISDIFAVAFPARGCFFPTKNTSFSRRKVNSWRMGKEYWLR